MEKYAKFRSEKYMIEIEYPSDWKAEAGQQNVVAIFTPQGPQQGFKSNINLIVSELPSASTTLKDFTAATISQVGGLFGNRSLVSVDYIESHGSDAAEMIYTGKLGEHDIAWLQIFWVKDSKAYILTSSTAQSSAVFPQVMQRMADSFTHG